MGRDSKEPRELALQQELEKKRVALEYKEKLRILQEQKDYAAKRRNDKMTADINKTQKKADENMRVVNEYRSGKGQQSNYRSADIGTFYSWIMNSVPEFEAIVKTFCYSVHAKRKSAIAAGRNWVGVGGLSHSLYYNTKSYFDSPEHIQIPPLKYINAVDADGKITFELIQDIFGDLLKREDGEPDTELADSAQQIFQGYVNEWLDSLDGLDDAGGYFIYMSGRPQVSRVYKKADGEEEDGVYTPKADCMGNFITTDQYENLVQGLGYPEKSLSVFLQNKCLGSDVEFEPVSQLGPK